jgi:hypothetical protein
VVAVAWCGWLAVACSSDGNNGDNRTDGGHNPTTDGGSNPTTDGGSAADAQPPIDAPASDGSVALTCGPGGLPIEPIPPGGQVSAVAGTGASLTAGSCGGALARERVYRTHLPSGLLWATFRTRLIASNFRPILYVRRVCEDAASEAACAAAGIDTPAVVTLDSPAAGDYYAFIDGPNATSTGRSRWR